MDGWVKIHRKILDNPIVCKDSDHFAVWNYLLLNAAHKDMPVLFNGKKMILKSGQLITKRREISEHFKTKIDESKVKRILIAFKSDQQIDQQASNQNTLITIVNWGNYQCESDQQNDQQMTNGCPTDDQRKENEKSTKKDKDIQELKNIKKSNTKVLPKESTQSYEDVFNSSFYSADDEMKFLAFEFIKMRKLIKKPLTNYAFSNILKKLERLSGGDKNKAVEIIKNSIDNCYQGVFPLEDARPSRAGTKRQDKQPMSRHEYTEEQINAMLTDFEEWDTGKK